ncbi:MAG TPA: SUF system Fe-S cluster assembly protein [Vicinamibacterales bacterium]|nr:SUF system Fe-S cluster assembly protein [Vicinamibacterales bacterium]
MSSPLNSDPGAERIIPLADAPAPTPQAAEPVPPATDAFARDPLNSLKFQPQMVEAVSKVFDPEIPVNIYELGLIYDMDVDTEANVKIRMTLTAPACPAAQTIPLDVERRVREVAGLKDVKVEVVWDPPWTRDRMSEAAKLSLGML